MEGMATTAVTAAAMTATTATATTATTTIMTTDTTTGVKTAKETHAIQLHLQKLAAKLPKAGEGGEVCITRENTRGRESKKSREVLKTQKELVQCFDENGFPNFPVCFAADPKKRATTHRVGRFWTLEAMELARDEFVVPAELKTITMCPETPDRDLPKKRTEHQTATGGVMSPCTKCKTNQHMRQTGWTSSRRSTPHSLNKEMTHDTALGGTFECFSPDSGCCKVNEKSKRKKGKTFTACEGEFWKQHPQEVRDRHSEHFSMTENRSANAIVSPGLCGKVLFDSGTFEDMARQLNTSLDDRCRRASASCNSHGLSFRSNHLPGPLPFFRHLLCSADQCQFAPHILADCKGKAQESRLQRKGARKSHVSPWNLRGGDSLSACPESTRN
jgi:hypothetical protein